MSVGLSVLTVSPAKMAEPLEMPFEMWTQVGLWNCVRWGPGPLREGALLRGMTLGFFPHATGQHCQWP